MLAPHRGSLCGATAAFSEPGAPRTGGDGSLALGLACCAQGAPRRRVPLERASCPGTLQRAGLVRIRGRPGLGRARAGASPGPCSGLGPALLGVCAVEDKVTCYLKGNEGLRWSLVPGGLLQSQAGPWERAGPHKDTFSPPCRECHRARSSKL